MKKYSTFPEWNARSVKMVCVEYDFYTRGTNDDYNKMLAFVEKHPFPSYADVMIVAIDIFVHTDRSVYEYESDDTILHGILADLWRKAITMRCSLFEEGDEE